MHQAREAGWASLRKQEIALAERDSDALTAARAVVAAQKYSIPKDAAVCFVARKEIDRKLRAAMGPGKEFGEALSTWHADRKVVNQFCAYALTIGAGS